MDDLKFYLILINILALVVMGVDKIRAIRHRWRIPERTIFLTAIIGGCPGALIGMMLFRHKIRNKLFAIGLPVMFFAQFLLLLVISRI